jgi:hypothetical protein
MKFGDPWQRTGICTSTQYNFWSRLHTCLQTPILTNNYHFYNKILFLDIIAKFQNKHWREFVHALLDNLIIV